jgi:hypothetical protein
VRMGDDIGIGFITTDYTEDTDQPFDP